jgi:hypothetical protein
MIIQGRRIRNANRYLQVVNDGTPIIIGIDMADIRVGGLQAAGFPAQSTVNDSILPAAHGAISSFNANGRHDVQHHLPFETVTHSVYTTWTDWHGNEHSGYVARDYRRRPRLFVPPPGVELVISARVDGTEVVTTPSFIWTQANAETAKHRINLLLELFGRCEVFTEGLDRIIQAPIHRLNWRLLPPGPRPFAQLQQHLAHVIQEAPESHQPVITNRLEAINSHHPDFAAIGEGGFHGYVVFGFQNQDLYLFESIFIGNATYVFGNNWQALSQMTKADIINNALALERIIHRPGWHQRIQQLLP